MCEKSNEKAAGKKLNAGEVIEEVKDWVVFVVTIGAFIYAIRSGSKMSLPDYIPNR